ncbi:MAG: AraC family transcriptional regulator [Oscillospiraceae bacterium]|nr:AraC family transcriptional regulator [Oscillospiraceae bacterium]
MSMNKELNNRLLKQSEEQQSHVEYEHEYGFYDNITAGNMEAVKKLLADPEDVKMYEAPEYGRLSRDPLQNIRYHFVVSAALITRLCVEKGLERELAYTLSDLYIGKMDCAKAAQQIISLHNEMLLDFTEKMAELPKRKIYSIQVIKAMEYIFHHRTARLTAKELADILQINRSYLSTLFKKETGIGISEFIRREKIKAAENMLKFSDYSYSEIGEYFGFASQSHFTECFKKETGMTPKEYRKRFSQSQESFSK